MPFVNGRFYINPAHGRALERPRLAEAERHAASQHGEQQQQAGHWVTIDHRHVFIREGQAGRLPYDNPQNESEARLANIVYNETASLHPGTRATPGREGSAEDPQKARLAVAEIANRAAKSGHPKYVAPSELNTDTWKALAGGNPAAVAAHNTSLAAARQALAGSDITNGATQFRMRENGDIRTPIEGVSPITMHFGPFLDMRPDEKPKTMVVAR